MRKVKVLGALIGIWLAGASLHADTRTGTSNTQSIQSWSFIASGPVHIVLSWTKKAADLDMILVCQGGVPAGVDLGVLDRVATIQVDPPVGSCLLGISSFRGSSAYRVHFLEGASLVSQPAGRQPRTLKPDDALDELLFEAQRVLWSLQQSKEANLAP